MGNKNQNQKTEEKKEENAPTQAAENKQTENASEKPAESAQSENAGKSEKATETSQTEKVEEAAENPKAEKTVKMVLKHKSHTPHYHRCGLTLSKTFAEYEVPESAVEKLKADKWIVVQESK
ncbi:MAG: hypothetical protein J5930_05320 [Treponema sp.]|nr:hypothetical protein [Treponema sp.]